MRIQDLSSHLRQLLDNGFNNVIRTVGGLPNFPVNVSMADSLVASTQLDYWVDGTNGNDENVGDQASPLKTIQQAYARIGPNVTGPITVHIMPGTYLGPIDYSGNSPSRTWNTSHL